LKVEKSRNLVGLSGIFMQHSDYQKNSQNGFTLIELLIVTALMVILTLTVSAMFMTFMVTNARTNTKNTLKVEGSYALSQIEFMLRNSYKLVENSDTQVCQGNMDRIALESIDGGQTEFFLDTSVTPPKIASNSGTYLTSDTVQVANLQFDCSERYSGERSVTIDFDLSKVVPSISNTTSEESSQHFSSVVSLRN